MDTYRYGLTRQGSSDAWRSLRDGDFEEEEVWDVMRDRKDSIKPDLDHSSSVSITRKLSSHTASRMIRKATTSTTSASTGSLHEPKLGGHQQSLPVNIPDWSNVKRTKKVNKTGSSDDDDDDDDEEMMNGGYGGASEEDSYDDDDDGGGSEFESSNYRLPPHELISRRLARTHVSSFSVFEGVGRTLKGRDLSKVRNAVLTKTGFLESL